jgi:hypothetical protein
MLKVSSLMSKSTAFFESIRVMTRRIRKETSPNQFIDSRFTQLTIKTPQMALK